MNVVRPVCKRRHSALVSLLKGTNWARAGSVPRGVNARGPMRCRQIAGYGGMLIAWLRRSGPDGRTVELPYRAQRELPCIALSA